MSEADPKHINAIVIPRGDPPAMPGRNTYALFGRELIGWVLVALKHSRSITGVFVSTRDEALANVVREAGCEVIPRPEELDHDRAMRVDVVRHGVNWLHRERLVTTDIALAIRASIPELRARDIDNGIEFLQRNGLREVLSMGGDCMQNDDIRIISKRALFSTSLSNRIGVMKTDYIDVRSTRDIATLTQRYENRQRFEATRE